MKILHVGHFDCAGVAWNLANAFNRLHVGVHEMRTCFPFETMAARHAHERVPATDEAIRPLLKDADLVILHAGVHDYASEAPVRANEGGKLTQDILDVPWLRKMCPPRKAVLWLNGSTSSRKHVGHYKKLYQGYRLFATNTDMAALYDATWLPPCVAPDWDDGTVRHRWGAGRTVCHFGTDPAIKNTKDLHVAASAAGWTVRKACGELHERLPLIRDKSQVCFDHMQGYTGVVSMESAAVGQANIVHMSETERAAWGAYGVPVPPFYDVDNSDDLSALLVRFMSAMPEVAERGRAGRAWYEQHMTNAKKAALFSEIVL